MAPRARIRTIAQSATDEVQAILSSSGLAFDLGAASVVVRSSLALLARQIGAVYPHFPAAPAPEFADIRIRLDPPSNWRRLVRPQIALKCDGDHPFYPFPADTALPLMEWGTNWLIGQRLHHLLLFHAGCLERDGLGLLLPAIPGSGKSTLTAALAHRGWRLLSDEFGVCEPTSGMLLAMLKPIALKNESIAVIRSFATSAVMGPEFPNTRKGTVVHVAATEDAVRRRCEPAEPAVVILPQWRAGSATTLTPLTEEDMFRALAFNSFNYEVLGQTGFDAVVRMVRQSRGWRLEYGDLHDAVQTLDERWAEMSSHGLVRVAG